jgi:putative membrane protein
MLAFIVVCIVLAISATYELIEWWVALAAGQGATDFLGTQGDPWDTQSDMFLALIGAVVSLLLLSGLQDRQIRALTSPFGRHEQPNEGNRPT